MAYWVVGFCLERTFGDLNMHTCVGFMYLDVINDLEVFGI